MQAEALRGDPEGFVRQQEVLNDARALVKRAEEQVAQLVKNTPSLEQVRTSIILAHLHFNSTGGLLTAHCTALVATQCYQTTNAHWPCKHCALLLELVCGLEHVTNFKPVLWIRPRSSYAHGDLSAAS